MASRLAFACAALLTAANAGAQTTIVIESVVGQETSEVDSYLPEVVKGLGSPPARSGASLGADIEAHFGPAPARLSSSAIAELAARLKKSERSLFLSGTHTREAIDDLEDVRSRLADSLWTLAHTPDARALYLNVLLKLARAYQINARIPEAASLAEKRMQEVARYFRDLPPDPTKIENELANLLAKCQQQLPATSSIRVSTPGINSRICANGYCSSGSSINLPAGEYRFFVSTPHGDGRVAHVTLGEAEHKLFNADVDFEIALRTDSFVGFAFDSNAQREKYQAGFAATLAGELRATEVVVLGELPIDGKRHVVLSAYGNDRTLLTAIGTPGAPGVVATQQARRVAERLRIEEAAAKSEITRPTAEQDQSAALVVVASAKNAQQRARTELTLPPSAPPARSDHAPSTSMRGLEIGGWTLLGIGFPVTLVGSYLYARQYLGTCESPTHLCPHSYSNQTTSTLGFSTMTVGEGLMGLGLVIGWIEAERPLRNLGIHLAVDGLAVLISGGLQYQTAQYPIRFDRQSNGTVQETTPQTAHDQGTDAIVQLSLGAALIAGGTVLALADHYILRRRTPAFSLLPTVNRASAGILLSQRF